MMVLVIGEVCTDVFIYGEIKRLSPEAPVPVLNPLKEVSNDGMAKNVLNNVAALKVEVFSITNKNSIRKIRYVDYKSNQLVLRVDEHDFCDRIEKDTLLSIKDNVTYMSMAGRLTFDAIIISDYCKGFLTEDDIKFICENNTNVFVDTKKRLGKWIVDCDYLKINDLEYEQNKDFFETPGNHHILKKTIITKGRNGCEFQGKIYSTDDVPVKDISGAGDTFLAGLTKEYVKTKNIFSAISFAQDCTKIVVQKHGVSTI